MKRLVSIRKCADYSGKRVRDCVEKVFNDIEGAAKYLKRGEKVLLKPNFLTADPKKKGIITHPEVIRAVAEIALDLGCKVKIGDSPGLGNVAGILEKSGFGAFFNDLPVDVVDFNSPVEISNLKGKRFRKFTVDKEVLEADSIINMPKVKSHGQMMMTLAVKNMFGAVNGKLKPQWHLKAGRTPYDFAAMLLEIHYLLKPALNIIDGVWGMDGNGPSGGDPFFCGFLGASQDADALDRVVCRILKVDENAVYTLKAARESTPDGEGGEIDIAGDGMENFDIHGFKLPRECSLETLGVAVYMAGFLKDALTDRPRIDRKRCILCGDCVRQCPSSVMSICSNRGGDHVKIDYRNCIRCYCCQEICPEHAIGIKPGWLLNLLRTLRRRSS